jgi:hypothetical protein
MKEPTQYYQYQFNDSLIYQDWLMVELAKRGIIIQIFGSKEYQYKHGESFSKDEIKFDKEQLQTGNLCIEEFEKTNEYNSWFVESGINRQGIARWFQGNYENLWIFECNKLRQYLREGINREINKLNRYVTKTSKGIILPCIEADRICTQKIRFHDKELKESVVITRPIEVPYEREVERKEKLLSKFIKIP